MAANTLRGSCSPKECLFSRSRLRKKLFAFEISVKRRDEIAVAVPNHRWHMVVGTKHQFGSLSPIGVCNIWIDICPKTISSGHEGFPKCFGSLVGKSELHNRFDGLKAVFPWD